MVLIECFHSQNETLVNRIENMTQKIISVEVLKGFQATSMSIKYPKVTVLLLLMQLGHTKHCSMYKYIYCGIFGDCAVNPNTPHSPPVRRVFNEIAQYLRFFMFFLGVTIMTSAS